ncbi:FimV/HubP family polar landmark protein [Kingella negevensis]|uniref:FimV/HubP family polar landmark protein n=1 Tax=Kingella negevensis TaxID=1522312 RepID=UPI002543937C|nr:FimV/HubP family polar landmark protein [Kingella negevensis]WII93265.1 FimV/HubP family polar landmark protein [Kingella negevensis]
MKTHTKVIATSLSLMTTYAMAGVGGLNVQSNLGEPFSGSILVTGREAEALIKSGSVSVSGGGVHGTVVPQGENKALIHLRSSSPVNEPILDFSVKAGNQTRQYTVMVNPSNYRPKQANNSNSRRMRKQAAYNVPVQQPAENQQDFAAVDVEASDEVVAQRARPAAAYRRAKTGYAPRYYRVHSGETLASIAARYRPHRMSVQRAMRALVAANPRAFRNGRMYRNVTLYIPSASQWYAYSNSYKVRSSYPRSVARPSINNVVDDGMNNNAAPAANTAPVATPSAPQTQPVTPPPAPAKDATPPTPPKAEVKPEVKPEAVKPEEKPAVTVKASEVASAPAASTTAVAAEEKVASATELVPATTSQPEAAQAASVAAASSASAAVVPASQAASAPKPKKHPPMPVEEPVEEEGFDWLGLGVPAAAGLAALGGGAYFLNRRRKANAEDAGDEEFEDDDVEFDSEDSGDSSDDWEVDQFDTANNTAPKWDTAPAAPENSSFQTDDNDFFDLPAAEESAPAKPANSTPSFNLDDFEPSNLADTPVAAPAAVEEDDFEWATTETAPASDASANDWLADDTFNTESAPAETTSADDDEWLLDDTLTVSEPAVQAAESAEASNLFDFDLPAEPVSAPATNTNPVDDFDLDMAESALGLSSEPATPTAAIDPKPASKKFDELMNFDLAGTAATAATTVAATTAVAAQSNEDILSFDLPSEEPSASIASVQSEPAELSLDDFSSLDFSTDTIATQATAVSEVNEFADFNLDMPSEPAAPVANAEVSLDDFGLDLPTEVAAPVADLAMNNFDLDTPAAPAIDALNDLSLDMPTIEEPAVALDAPAVPVADFSLDDMPAVEEPVATLDAPEFALDDLSFDVPVQEAAQAVEAGLADFDLAMDAPAAPATEPSMDFALDDFEAPAQPAAEPMAFVDDSSIDLSAFETTQAPQDAGFVSESVSSEAPHEAKLELAKMYLEIDDAVAARETLRELLVEAGSGEFYDQAKQLLDELGG